MALSEGELETRSLDCLFLSVVDAFAMSLKSFTFTYLKDARGLCINLAETFISSSISLPLEC